MFSVFSCTQFECASVKESFADSENPRSLNTI